MQTRANFSLWFTEIDINFFSDIPKLASIIKVSPSPNIKK